MTDDNLKSWKDGLVGLIQERERITEDFNREVDFWAEMDRVVCLSRDLRGVAQKKLVQRYGARDPEPAPIVQHTDEDAGAGEFAQRFAPQVPPSPPYQPTRAQRLASDIVGQINSGAYVNGQPRQ